MKVSLFLLVLLSFGCCYGQTPLFRHFTSEDGLPSSQVYQVLEDAGGYLWFATDHGVSKYNGYEFKTYTSADGLLDNTVFKLECDEDNRLWMMTSTGQFFYFENEKIHPFRHNDKVLGVVNNHTPSGFFSEKGAICFTASWIGEFRIDASGRISNDHSFYSDTLSNSILFHSSGKRFIASGHITSSQHPAAIYINESGVRDTFIVTQQISGPSALVRKKNKLILAASGLLIDLNRSGNKILARLNTEIIDLFVDGSGRLWACTYNGVFRFDDIYNDSIPAHYLANNYLSSAYQDREDGIWFTSINNGVFYLGSDKIKSLVFNDPELSEPLSLTAMNNTIYAGFWNGKVIRLNNSGYTIVHSSPAGTPVNSLFADAGSDKIYMSQNVPGFLQSGAFHELKCSRQTSLKGNFIKRKNGEIYNASINHIFKVKSDSLLILSPLTKRANCCFEDNDGRIILGCNKGAFYYDENSHVLTLVDSILNETRVDDIAAVNEKLCFATRGKGVYIQEHDSFLVINQSSGLSSNIVHRLAVSGNTLWCVTYNGISRISFDASPAGFKITTIGINEGLQSNEVNDIIIMNDTVWAASKSAVSFFNVHALFANVVPPVIHFSGLKINNTDTTADGPLTLKHNANTIRIAFEAISFRSSGNIIYRYSLVNEEDTFVSATSSRQVEFIALKPGDYTFSVKAVNTSGVESRPAILQFSILKPFWQQWWFRIIVLLTAASAAIMIMQARIRNIRKQEAMKTAFNKQLVRLEIKALRAQMNPHFIFNVMNSIQDYILKNDTKSAQRYLTKFARLVRLILDNSVSEEVLLSDELKAAELYVELEQQRFEQKFEFEIRATGVEADEILIPSMIIQPYLENAIKHGIRHLKGTGKLSLEVSERDDSIFIVIEDNGVGRKAAAEWNRLNESEHISHGSVITANRIEAFNIAHNTNILTSVNDISDVNGKSMGTRVELVIPVRARQIM